MTVLYVDDDPDDFDIFCEAMGSIAPTCECISATNGLRALHVLNSLTPDYIFLDVNMPGMDGHETLKLIRSSEKFGSVPVVMFSTAMPEYAQIEYISGGASYCLAKPTSYKELCLKLNLFLFQQTIL